MTRQGVLNSHPDTSLDVGRVMAKAVFNAAGELGLRQIELATIIGVSKSVVSRDLKDGGYVLKGQPFNLAAYLVRIFRSLDAIAGGDPDVIRGWMANDNTDLNGRPRDLIRTAAGLVDVMNYLDAARAPV